MKIWVLIAALLVTSPVFAQSARAYYDELYKAGGLDRMADGHVCFADDLQNLNFFIFGQSKYLREYMRDAGTLAKLPKAVQQQLKDDFLIVRGYTNGVPMPNEDFYTKEGDSWVMKDVQIGKSVKARIRITISWATLRYNRAVEVLNADGTVKDVYQGFGRCEAVSPTIQQRDQ